MSFYDSPQQQNIDKHIFWQANVIFNTETEHIRITKITFQKSKNYLQSRCRPWRIDSYYDCCFMFGCGTCSLLFQMSKLGGKLHSYLLSIGNGPVHRRFPDVMKLGKEPFYIITALTFSHLPGEIYSNYMAPQAHQYCLTHNCNI